MKEYRSVCLEPTEEELGREGPGQVWKVSHWSAPEERQKAVRWSELVLCGLFLLVTLLLK